MEFATLMMRKKRCFVFVEIRRFSNNLARNEDPKSAPQTVKKYFVCTPEAMPPECNSWTVFCPVDSFKQAKWRGTVSTSPVLPCVLCVALCDQNVRLLKVSMTLSL